jgi:PAS domain S-box-containing protein
VADKQPDDLTESEKTEIDRLKSLLEEREETIRSLEERLSRTVLEERAILDSAIDAVIVVNGKDEIVYFNRAAEQMFGYLREEVTGEPLHSILVSGESRDKYLDHYGVFAETGRCPVMGERTELLVSNRDGERFPVELSVSSFRIGDEWYSAGTIRNVAMRKMAEESLRESERRFRTIFENSPSGISIANDKGEIILCNPAYRKMLGYEDNDMPRRFADMTHPHDLKENMRLFEEMLQGERDHYHMHKRYIRKDGGIIWANLTVTAVRDDRGRFLYNFAIVEDISERKKLEDQLRHSQKMEAVGQLAGGIAHDFNNMLTAVTGYANLLKMKLGEMPSLQHYAGQILAICERGAHLTKSLVAFSRKQMIEARPVNLNVVIETVGRIIPRLIWENIEVTVKTSDIDLVVMADSGQIEQTIINLAANARDAMPDGGSLLISTRAVTLDRDFIRSREYGRPGRYAVVSVSDSGIGIDEENLDRIFEPFFSTKDAGRGTGLGLSIVYNIVKQHSGYIDVKSQKGMGTTFDIYLPLHSEKALDEIGAYRVMKEMRGGSILVVEDEKVVRKAFRSVLEEAGFTIIEAEDGVEAVEICREHSGKIDAVIFDIIMPRKGGIEAYEEISRIRPGIKALFVSGYSVDESMIQKILKRGLYYIPKPFRPDELLNAIRKLFNA